MKSEFFFDYVCIENFFWTKVVKKYEVRIFLDYVCIENFFWTKVVKKHEVRFFWLCMYWKFFLDKSCQEIWSQSFFWTMYVLKIFSGRKLSRNMKSEFFWLYVYWKCFWTKVVKKHEVSVFRLYIYSFIHVFIRSGVSALSPELFDAVKQKWDWIFTECLRLLTCLNCKCISLFYL